MLFGFIVGGVSGSSEIDPCYSLSDNSYQSCSTSVQIVCILKGYFDVQDIPLGCISPVYLVDTQQTWSPRQTCDSILCGDGHTQEISGR